MLRILKIDLPLLRLEHRNGHQFNIKSKYKGTGELILEPEHGWGELCVRCQQDVESLYEDIDNLIYSAMPELYERHV